jgi:hypothetical protein
LDDAVALAAAGDVGSAIQSLESSLSTVPAELRVEDAAARVMNLVLCVRFLADAAPDVLIQRVGAAVIGLQAGIGQALPRGDADLADVLTCTTATGLLWPALPGARRAWTHGLTGLSRSGAARARPDGTARDGDPSTLLAWVERVLLLAMAARDEGVGLPTSLTSAAAAAAWHLYVRSAPTGYLPSGAVPPILAEAPLLAPSARNVSLALGWIHGDTAAVSDGGRLAAWFGGGTAAVGTARPLADSDWSMWTYRDGGVAVLHTLIRGKHVRVVVDAGSPRTPGTIAAPEVEIGGGLLLGGDASVLRPVDATPTRPSRPAELLHARVDVSTGRAPRRGRVVVVDPTVGPAGVRREIVLRQARVIVEDEVSGDVAGDWESRWTFGPGWRAVCRPDGSHAAERDGAKPIKVELDERWIWNADGGTFSGRGRWEPGADPIRLAFEWT